MKKKQQQPAKASFEIFGVNLRKLRDRIVEAVKKDFGKAKKWITKRIDAVIEAIENTDQLEIGLLLCPLAVRKESFALWEEVTVRVFGFRLFLFKRDNPTAGKAP